jgi:hypothetical protein
MNKEENKHRKIYKKLEEKIIKKMEAKQLETVACMPTLDR